MSFFKILIFLSLILIPTISISDSHDQKKEVLEQVKEIAGINIKTKKINILKKLIWHSYYC